MSTATASPDAFQPAPFPLNRRQRRELRHFGGAQMLTVENPTGTMARHLGYEPDRGAYDTEGPFVVRTFVADRSRGGALVADGDRRFHSYTDAARYCLHLTGAR